MISELIHIDTTIAELKNSRNITTDEEYYEYLNNELRFSDEVI